MKRILFVGAGLLLFVAACHLDAPSDLAATAFSPTQINLTWSDTANSESDYRIERSPDNSTFTEIASVPFDSTSYSDTAVPCGATRYYRIRAHMNAFDSVPEEFGSYSNTANATTDPCGGSPACVKVSTDWRFPYNNGTCPSGFQLVQIAVTGSGGVPACTKFQEDYRYPYGTGACPSGFNLVYLVPTNSGGVPACTKLSTDYRYPYGTGACPSGFNLVYLATAGGST